MKESLLLDHLKKGLPTKGLLTRVETPTSNGVPDCVLDLPGVPTFWVELKTTTALRPNQVLFAERTQATGKEVLLIKARKRPDGSVVYVLSTSTKSVKPVVFTRTDDIFDYIQDEWRNYAKFTS